MIPTRQNSPNIKISTKKKNQQNWLHIKGKYNLIKYKEFSEKDLTFSVEKGCLGGKGLKGS